MLTLAQQHHSGFNNGLSSELVAAHHMRVLRRHNVRVHASLLHCLSQRLDTLVHRCTIWQRLGRHGPHAPHCSVRTLRWPLGLSCWSYATLCNLGHHRSTSQCTFQATPTSLVSFDQRAYSTKLEERQGIRHLFASQMPAAKCKREQDLRPRICNLTPFVSWLKLRVCVSLST